MMPVACANAFDVVSSLFERWDPVTVIEHSPLAGIITRQRQIYPPTEHGHQFLQILCPTTDVVRRVIRTRNAESACGSRHQLHQASGAFRANYARMKVRFLLDYEEYQVRIDTEVRTVLPDELVDQRAT